MIESDNDGFIYANYANPEYDQLMDDAAKEVDLIKRAAILKQAVEIFLRDLPYIPLLFYGSMNMVSDQLNGWEDNIQNVHPTRYLRIVQ